MKEKKEGTEMQEIETKENPLNLKVYVNGKPDLRLIPKEKAESILSALEMEISEYYQRKQASQR